MLKDRKWEISPEKLYEREKSNRRYFISYPLLLWLVWIQMQTHKCTHTHTRVQKQFVWSTSSHLHVMFITTPQKYGTQSVLFRFKATPSKGVVGCVCVMGGHKLQQRQRRGLSGTVCARQLLPKQLLMSTEQQLAGLPEDSLPASSQMEGIRIGGGTEVRISSLVPRKWPPLPLHPSRILNGIHLQQLVFPNLDVLPYLLWSLLYILTHFTFENSWAVF